MRGGERKISVVEPSLWTAAYVYKPRYLPVACEVQQVVIFGLKVGMNFGSSCLKWPRNSAFWMFGIACLKIRALVASISKLLITNLISGLPGA